jgi:hypothetical protein
VRRHAAHVVRALALTGGCVLLVALFVRLGPGRILSLLRVLGPNLLVVVGIFTGHELVRALAIRRWLPADSRPPLADLLRIRLMGEAAGALTRTGTLAAESSRAWLLANQGGQGLPGYSAAAGELMANSATSAAVNALVCAFALLMADLKGPIVVLAHVLLWSSLVYVSGIVAIVVSGVSILGACTEAASRLPFVGPRLRADPVKVRNLEESFRSALTGRKAEVARVVALELAAQAVLVFEVYWAIRSIGVAVSAQSALFIEIMTRALTIVECVGATEMGFAVVFTWLGLPAAIGFTLSLVRTLRSVTTAGIVIGVLTIYQRASLALNVDEDRKRYAVAAEQ